MPTSSSTSAAQREHALRAFGLVLLIIGIVTLSLLLIASLVMLLGCTAFYDGFLVSVPEKPVDCLATPEIQCSVAWGGILVGVIIASASLRRFADRPAIGILLFFLLLALSGAWGFVSHVSVLPSR